MKDYYKVLQVDKDASPDIIKVAYKLLVKKYHPDLKEGSEKKEAEEKIKKINEAYEVLSDKQKKAEYDQSIFNETISQEQYQNIMNENINLKRELDYLRNRFNTIYNRNTYVQPDYTNMYDNSTNQNTYYNNQNTSNENNRKNIFNIEYLKNFLTEKIKTLIALILTFLLIFILFKLPFFRNLLPDAFNTNYLLLVLAIAVGYYYFFKGKQ